MNLLSFPASSRLLPSVLALLLLSTGVSRAAQKPRRAEHVPPARLTNLMLSPELARWLVGPISWLASEEEIEEFLVLTSDERAEEFIERFWQEHAAVRETFERRAAEADKKFREGTTPGRQTDRGLIWVLYGPPETTEWEDHLDVAEPNVEVWLYPADAEPGLDRRQPQRRYRFARDRDVTTFYQRDPQELRRRRLRDRLDTGPPG